MRGDVRFVTMFAVAVGTAMGAVALAQSPACTLSVNGYIGIGPLPKTGLPYSATVKTTFEQKLGDGNSIHAGHGRSRRGTRWGRRCRRCRWDASEAQTVSLSCE
jgi:hypothetical protein